MNQLRIPGSAQRRADGSAIIDSLNLNRACNAVCDICGHGRNSKAHRANRCSEKRREMSLAAARLLEQHNAIGSGR